MRENTFQKCGTTQKSEEHLALFIRKGIRRRLTLIVLAISARPGTPIFQVHFIKRSPDLKLLYHQGTLLKFHFNLNVADIFFSRQADR